MEIFVVTFIFGEQRYFLSEQQNPVFRQKPTFADTSRYIFDISLQTTLYDAKLCVDSKSATKNIVALRNLEKIWKNWLSIFAHLVVYVTVTEKVENKNWLQIWNLQVKLHQAVTFWII